MAIYECVYIARQELTAAQAEQLSKDLAKIVSSNNGEIKSQEYWGLRNLAYKIRKNRRSGRSRGDKPSKVDKMIVCNFGESSGDHP